MLQASELFISLDDEIEQHGTLAAARWLLPRFVAEHKAYGTEIIPDKGPLLIAANHPASYDAVVISAYVNRPGFKLVIGEIPPYRYLPHLSNHAIFSPNLRNTFGRMQTLQNVIQHLEKGGAALIFPRGGIEPDPSFMPEPGSEFDKWSRSLEIILRRVPTTQVLVTIVGGVLSQTCMRHPFTWFRRTRPDRQRLAFMYQIIRQMRTGRELYGLHSRVIFGEVLQSMDHRVVLEEIRNSAHRTLHRFLEHEILHKLR